ncbi:MAG: glycoside hydrolase family 95 protein [Candidatus Aminicenantes bacterium]|nr:MAG: glycoside hydrolase family 95 protein [Candidatus Aminicenantes bacterium]
MSRKIWGTKYFVFILFVLIFFLPFVSVEGKNNDAGPTGMRLWYKAPAKEWTEALPVGNGRLGGMVFGGVEKEHIQFNEDSLWTGIPRDYSNPQASKYLSEIRQLLLEGKQSEAEGLAMRTFMSIPLRQERYQPFGDIWIEFGGSSEFNDYRRELDLDKAVALVRYKRGDVTYTRTVFVSYPAQAMVIHLSADKPKQLNFILSITSPHTDSQIKTLADSIVLNGQVSDYTSRREKAVRPSILKFESRLKVLENDGNLAKQGNNLHITQASNVTLILAGATSYKNYHDISADPAERNEKILFAIEGSYDALLDKHVKDHQSLFRRVDIDLGWTEQAKMSTDERVLHFREGKDPQLAALVFQYGRYLMIASSRPGSQPANLQGIWNDRLDPPWESKYTTNINFEMNYWPAELCNLSECHEPMFNLIEDCSITGMKAAKMHYDCRGWVVHHNTDIWRGAAPINASNHGIWPTGGAWMCQHLWLRYAFTQDKEFLRSRAYPILKKAVLFFVDYLIVDPRNDKEWLISGPSNSPEIGGLVMGPTMDHQIIRNLFSNTIEASEILKVDPAFRRTLKDLHARIAPNQIGQYGQLQEWLEDRDDPENKHRHVSHLWGLHPGNEITEEETPELFEAARKSLEMRGDEGTGWSMGWKVNFWARLRDGNRAFKLINNLLRLTGSSKTEYTGGGVYPNLFDSHPPFQIDGNFGVTSGVTEMLLQSHCRDSHGDYVLELLPALPSAWPTGHVKGLCARGGFEVDIRWIDGELIEAKILSKAGLRCSVKYQDKSVILETAEAAIYSLDTKMRIK